MSFGDIKVNGVPVDTVLYENTLYQAQSTYFVTLVLMQWSNLLMTRTRRLSIVQQPPIGPRTTRNLYIFPAMLFTLSVLVLFVFTTFFQNIFHTRDITVQYWFIRTALLLPSNDSAWLRRGSPTYGRDAEVLGTSVPYILFGKYGMVKLIFGRIKKQIWFEQDRNAFMRAHNLTLVYFSQLAIHYGTLVHPLC